jgi:O-methyltransferase involved in polyketide biosynthesis
LQSLKKECVDNGTIHWYDLDLPSVIQLRSELLPEPERATYISNSLFDSTWFTEVENTENGVFVIVAGVLVYFEESRIRPFFISLADSFPSGEIVFLASRDSESSSVTGVCEEWG